ncbi:hypothetical protein JWG39_06390 [Desulforhopalus vacuolatus]|uniref:hypothetical protein n=1 Tax=Desulforhopalus vacuolatus TaxID=40414 RepID=UPI001964EF2B|nr:hypothetical protein [Desulforhopalus vacuolatus]MBM9519447.1 hypothetical protein [Desulforhopalus vacuolatus]
MNNQSFVHLLCYSKKNILGGKRQTLISITRQSLLDEFDIIECYREGRRLFTLLKISSIIQFLRTFRFEQQFRL